MTGQHYQLLRIIIIDSFWRNQVNELSLNGHTQLEGTNGAGKTSLMRLLPLFYGMRPSEIVSKVDQAKNFVDYYLPRKSSMIIYEYQRPHEQTCMVLASSSDGRGVQYKFIDDAFNHEIFIGQDNMPLQVSDVERQYRQHGASSSNYLSVEKYRQVIQNLRSGRKHKEIRLLQQQFSLSERPAPHIDKVVNGTIEKNLDFDAVKKMLVAIVSDHLARDMHQEKENISLNKEDINSWLADIKASRAVKQVADKISLWQTDFINIDNLLTKLQHVHAELENHQTRLAQLQLEQEGQKSSLQEQIQAIEIELKELSFQLTEQINKLQTDIEADDSRIKRLDDDKFAFEEDDAASYQVKADRAPQYQQQLHEVNELIDSFEGDIQKVHNKFEALLQELKLQVIKEQAEFEQKSAQIKDLASHQLTEVLEKHQQQLIALNDQLNNEELTLKLSIQSVNNELQQLTSKLDNPVIDQQLQQALKQNQQAQKQVKDSLTELLKRLSDQKQSQSDLEKQRLLITEQHKQENRFLTELQQQRENSLSQLLPEEGSLQHFLSNEPAALKWKENIGRILSTQQLARQDLNPSWQEDSTQDFYGLSIDLEALTESELQLSESELRDKIALLDENIFKQTQKIEALDLKSSGITKSLKEVSISVAELTQQINQTELKQLQLDVQYENIQLNVEQFLKQQTEQLTLSQAQLQRQLKEQESALESHQENASEQQLDLQNQMFEQRSVIESDRDSQLQTLTEQKASFDESVKVRRRDYKLHQKQAIDELDPDGEVDKRIKQRSELQTKLKECARWQQKAIEYQQFMEDRYSQRDDLQAKNQTRSLQLQKLQSELKTVQAEKNNQLKSKQAQLKQLRKQLNEDSELLVQVNQMIRECEQFAINKQLDEHETDNDAQLAVVFCRDWLGQFTVIEKRLREQINRFESAFAKNNGNSELYNNWVELVSDHDHFSGAKQLFKYQQPIMDLLSSAEQKQKNTYQLVTVNANMINEFYQHIEHFARRIRYIGKQLSTNITKLAQFEALANINVDTVMKQEELEYWGPLQQFAKLFEQYRDELREGLGEIPDELIEAMQRLAVYLPSQGFELAHHQLFDVQFTIEEKGQIKQARNARQLKKISSTGLSYLAMLSLFAGILGMLRGESNHKTSIVLPVDELGELAAENVALLLAMFSENKIAMLSASPSTDRYILALYQRHYKLKDNKIYQAEIPKSRLDELLEKRNQQPTVKPQNLAHGQEVNHV